MSTEQDTSSGNDTATDQNSSADAGGDTSKGSTILTGGAETKAADAAAASEESKVEAPAADQNKGAESAPEPVKLEHNADMTIDAEAVGAVAEFANEHGLSQEQADAMLARDNQFIADVIQSGKDEHARQVQLWASDAKNDPEIGGAKFTESVENAKRAIDAYASDSLKEVLDESGYGNHPEVIRIMSKIGALIGDDKVVKGDVAPNTPVNPWDGAYPGL